MLQLVRIFSLLTALVVLCSPAKAVDNYTQIIAIPTNVSINTATTGTTQTVKLTIIGYYQ
jgi:hypothetical protein